MANDRKVRIASIGGGISDGRPDVRIAAAIHAALGDASTILNVDVGAWSYEPEDRVVMAVKPSPKMIARRSAFDATVVQSIAEKMPFDDRTFEASIAVLTVHYWTDKARGMAEMRQVSQTCIEILTYDPASEICGCSTTFQSLPHSINVRCRD